ncbi:MAG: histidine phosphatase family protein [Lewinellaceae bacterium]|nr:histidine phosphatase family protein [Lewinellaceae bacterium]
MLRGEIAFINDLTPIFDAYPMLMRSVFLIRHAKSSWDHAGLRDFDRPLNDRGERDAPRMGSLLAGLGFQPDFLISSPAKRAYTTACYFAKAFSIPETDIVREEGIYEASVQDILKLIASLPDAAHKVFLFGHNPTLTDVANEFSDMPIGNVPTCGIVRIDSSAPTWPELYEGNSKVMAKYFPKVVL